MGEEKRKFVKMVGGSFLSNSFSLREDNYHVPPTFFHWIMEGIASFPVVFYCDNGIYEVPSFPNIHTKNIALLVEPRALHPENYEFLEENHRKFHFILTYDRQLLGEIPNGLFYPLGGSSIAFEDWGIYHKPKKICMIASGKDTTPGHMMRKQIVDRFEGEIDFYGAGVGKPFDRKFDILKDYKYCVVVESDLSPDYFSEKLIDAVSVGCIPLHYCDRGNYSSTYFLKHNFTDLEGLEDLMILIRNHMLYDSIGQLKDNIKVAERFRIAEDFIWTVHQELFT